MLLLALGCRSSNRHEDSSPRVGPAATPGAADFWAEQKATKSPPGPLSRALAAAVPEVAPPVEDGEARRLSEQTALAMMSTEQGLVAVLSQEEGPAKVVRFVDGGVTELGHAPGRKPRLLALGELLLVNSSEGLFRYPAKGASLHRGDIAAAAVDGDGVIFAECSDDGPCRLLRWSAKTSAVRPFVDRELDVVHAIAVWGDRIVVAGRERDPREGKAPSAAAKAEQVRFLTKGGRVPGSMPYAPGFIVQFERDTRHRTRTVFETHRPVDLGVPTPDAPLLYVLTEGTPDRLFSDGALLQMDAECELKVLAKDLGQPDSLSVTPDRVCWVAMPGSHFDVGCHERSEGTNSVVIRQSMNLMAFADEGDALAYSVLMEGVFRQLPR